MKPYYIIQSSDVGKATIRVNGRVWLVENFMGQILPGDVGKYVYRNNGILSVENDERMAKRKADEKLPKCSAYPWHYDGCGINRDDEFRSPVVKFVDLSRATNDVDGRMMAAAPEMLSALRTVCQAIINPSNSAILSAVGEINRILDKIEKGG